MIYLNNAASSFPKPPCVVDAVERCLRTPSCDHARGECGEGAHDPALACRTALARLVGAEDPSCIFFTSGATESLNLAILGLDLDGQHVVTTQTEHNSVLRPLHRLERQGRIRLTVAPADTSGRVTPQAIEASLLPDTRVVVVNHCSNVTGIACDIGAITEIAHRKGAAVVVDAAQSAGECEFRAKEWGCDIVAFAGHKSLFGIPGIGAIYIREGLELTPLKTGGTGVRSELIEHPTRRPHLYEAGTLNMPGIVSLDAGVRFLLDTGVSTIAARQRAMAAEMVQQLRSIPGVTVHGRDGRLCEGTATVSFAVEGFSPDDVAFVLERVYGIRTRAGLHCAPLIHRALGTFPHGTVRASPSYLSPHSDIEALMSALGEIAAGKVAA